MAPNDVNSNHVSRDRGRLYLAALKGDWKSVKGMEDIQRPISRQKETALHIAVAANQEDFVKKLVEKLNKEDLEVQNNGKNTALTYAAATGNVNIAKVMLKKNENLLNLDCGMKPLRMAALSGHSEMVKFLYSKTDETVYHWAENEQPELFMTCVGGGFYGVALAMLRANNNLATAKNKDKENALHVLARNPSAFVSGSRPCLLSRHLNNLCLKLKKEKSKQSQAHELLKQCLQPYSNDIENLNEIDPELSRVLSIAADVGNVEFLVELIHFDFDLLYTIDSRKRSIFHTAVEKRHESIFNLCGVGSIRDLFADATVEEGNNMLHLAAGLSPEDKLNAISGAALQMQRELRWFKEVEKAVRPAFKEMKNNFGETPYALFARSHENLRKEGEKWMMNMAKSSTLVATLIGTIAFTYQPDDKLNLSPKLGLAYSVSSAIAVFFSSVSLITFLSILTSRYSYEDFLVWLPVKLMIGVTTLFISIAAMMVAFAASFRLKSHNHQELPLIIFVIGLIACVPILYVLLTYRLLADIVQGTCFRLQPRPTLLRFLMHHCVAGVLRFIGVSCTCESSGCLTT